MSKSKATTSRLVEVIRTSLAEAAKEGNALFLATWQEADSDGGYLLSPDGTMLGVGSYQYGFESLNDLLLVSPESDPDAAMYARQEAGRIASDLHPVSASTEDEPYLKDMLPLLFNDTPLANDMVSAGTLTIQDMFNMLSTSGRLQVFEEEIYTDPNVQVILAKDLQVCRLAFKEGKADWEFSTVHKAGTELEACKIRGTDIIKVRVGKGWRQLRPDEVSVEVQLQPRSPRP